MANEGKLIFKLEETKKHSGKYVLIGTENDMYPAMSYFRKDWFPNRELPQKVEMTLTEVK